MRARRPKLRASPIRHGDEVLTGLAIEQGCMSVADQAGAASPVPDKLCRGKGGADNRSYGVVLH